MNPETIKSYWMTSNDDGTYRLEIETRLFTINYDRVRVRFSCSENIAFPIVIKVYDSEDNELNEYSLIPNSAE